MNSYRCMKLKLSRRGDDNSDVSDQEASNPTQKDVLNSGQPKSIEVPPGARFSTKLKIGCIKRGESNQGLPGLCQVTPPPSPVSGGEQSDATYKELCIFEAKVSSGAESDIVRPFLSPATTDEEDTDIAKPKVHVKTPKRRVEMRPGEGFGMEDLSHNDASRKGDIFKCSFCERTFSYLCHLKVHERVHTGEKPYSCKFCSTQFSQLGSLTVHMRIHTGEKPYQCRQCSKRFRHINSLRRHQRQVHTGEKRPDASAKEQHPSEDDKVSPLPQINRNVFFNPYIQHHSFARDRVDPYLRKMAFNPADTFYAAGKNNFSSFPMSGSHGKAGFNIKLSPNHKDTLHEKPLKEVAQKTTSIFKSIEHLLGLNEATKHPHGAAKGLERPPTFRPAQKFDFTQPWGIFGNGNVEQMETSAKRIKTNQGCPVPATNTKALDLCTTSGVLLATKKRSHSDDGYGGSDEDVQMIRNESVDATDNLAVFGDHRHVSKIAEKQQKLLPLTKHIPSRKWSEDSGIAVSHSNAENHIVANA